MNRHEQRSLFCQAALLNRYTIKSRIEGSNPSGPPILPK